ncbi:Golgi transport complex subunit 1 [Mortierella sp. GBA43]|nr:Golgi transport complex subunit 1 [Mortierella sp. GBA43]
MTSVTAGDARGSGPVDADELFKKLSVPELNVYERRTRQDIENKKQELRMMVGERYRDLIGAADCIVRMKETAFSVQDNIARMRSSCDIHALKRNVASKTKKTQGSAMNDMKKSLYTSAAQIKLLADVPEQIWKNIENNNYLTASRLYLISKAIYTNLHAEAPSGDIDEEIQSVKVMETFPVVGRQWDAVSHFRSQILQKSQLHLKSSKETDMDVIETICAVMLLDDVAMKDMFQLVLKQRQVAIQQILETKSHDVGKQIVEAIKILKATLFHVGHIFQGSEQHGGISPLERHLRSLQQTFSVPSSNTSITPSTSNPTLSRDESLSGQLQSSAVPHLAASVIPRLYPTTPNIHLLVRYLPEPIQNYTPFIHLDGPKDKFTQEDLLHGVQQWIESIKITFSNGSEKLLQQVQTNTELVAIRSKVWAALQADELAMMLTKATPTTATKLGTSPFNDLCTLLLGESFSIWTSILQSGFVKTLQDVVIFGLEELSHQPDKILRHRLGELDQEEDPNHDVGGFIWDDTSLIHKNAALPSATEPLIQKIREYVTGRTDLVAQTIQNFEERLGAVRADQERAMVYERLVHEDADEEVLERIENLDIFHARDDTQQLVEYYQRHCVECIKTYTSNLEQLVKEAVQKPEKARNTVVALDRAMTIGRVALGIACMGNTLQRALTPPRGGHANSNFVQARAAKANVDSQVQGLVSGLQRVYRLSHEAWIESVEWTLNKSIQHYLKESSWTDLATLAWEPIPSATGPASPPTSRGSQSTSVATTTASGTDAGSSGSTGDNAKTLLPFHCSTRLITALHHICLEMHRVGTCYMKPELIQDLTVRVATTIIQAVNKFLTEVVDQSSSVMARDPEQSAAVVLSEKGALQLLLDTKFLAMVFQSSISTNDDLSKGFDSLLDGIRRHIDPVNLAVFEKPLGINADRQYNRVAVMLGLLVQLNPSESKRKVNVVEMSPHLFAMTPTPRFTLLPIGQKMTGRIG